MPRRRRPPRPGALADLSPTRILTQIVLLQLAYYACAAVLIVFTAIVAGKEVSTDLLLNWRSLRGDTTVGWTLGLVWVLNSLIWYAQHKDKLYSALTIQCYFHTSSSSTFKTGPRLRTYGTLHPPRRHISIFTCDTREPSMVDAPDMQRHRHDIGRRVGMSVARTQTHQFWRQACFETV
jgi:hypothetical protein